ncbi:FMN-binding negative transcriptional regulator [Streptomyces botrytidirepellens]|uniref:FMN-binding negative transcriptional regulator n=1 Tax=Streptomyces botrytidirepellens TaxID=2486417 RepID=A0A3M8VP72_9ACTN|nr:FMN-binding negative transcriptional regulator [Streptomyces botrytidirepellens]RNG18241.1 FMN-binding negative transcriptional regulator [Streptomyces botrytidirepellens]
MFVPCQYREPDGMWMVDLMRRNPLALLTTNGTTADGPFATHLPVIQDPQMDEEWRADLSGALLLGHMNRKNPHWSALRSGDVVLLVFTGPHAYVSPTVYRKTPAAPTWDFTAVHVHGVVEKIESLEETLGVVQSTVRAFEAELGTGWDMSESVEYFRRIVPGVGAFRVRVTGAEGMFKLSQEQQPEVRELVRESFARRDCGLHRETAELMGRLP